MERARNTGHPAHVPSETYVGVFRTASAGLRRVNRITRPWKAQLRALGKYFYLGSYETEEEAAKAFDNAAYWMGTRGYNYRRLNFPADYETETSPPPTPETLRAQSDFELHKITRGTLPTPFSASQNFSKLSSAVSSHFARMVELFEAAGYPLSNPFIGREPTSPGV
jgi:hypothetical protein